MKHLPKIVINVIPHKKQRYDTCGDYYYKKGELHIRVSQMNSNHEFLVLIHEITEWFLVTQKGVTIAEIDRFDMDFEKKRPKWDESSEPGNDPKAPYYNEHQFATHIEKKVAEELGVNWEKYDAHVNSL